MDTTQSTRKYQIGNVHDLNPDDPTFAHLRAATDDVMARSEGNTSAYGVWDVSGAVPEIIALAFEGEIFWRDGYTVREEA